MGGGGNLLAVAAPAHAELGLGIPQRTPA